MKDLVGKLIIAPPKVRGTFWQKTAVFITEHHNKGSVGLALNKASSMSVKEFAMQHGFELDVEGHVHVGGPVNVKAFTMLHSAGWRCDNTMRINDHFSLSSSPNMLAQLAMGNRPAQWRLFVGLSGWTVGQLENEINGNPPYDHNMSWLVANPDPSLVFDFDSKEQWTESIERSSSDFARSILV